MTICGGEIEVHGLADPRMTEEAKSLWDPLDSGRFRGVAVLGGAPRQLVAAPVMAPSLIGWVVFAADLDDREMRSLERLSAIPLNAGVVIRDKDRWKAPAGTMPDSTSAPSL